MLPYTFCVLSSMHARKDSVMEGHVPVGDMLGNADLAKQRILSIRGARWN